MSNVILKIEHLSKAFRSHWTFRPIEAVKDVSLEVFRGESFGFLGHNGAGKTTTMKCIVGLIHRSRGKIFFQGEELNKTGQRSHIGYLPEQPYFYDHLRVDETLDFFASLHGLKSPERTKRINETLELVGLADRKKMSVRALSKGLQQRLGFAQAIINKPTLLLLDEPFSGLDPIGRMEMRETIVQLKKEGTTIFLSSHVLSDVEDICDRVSIMAKGELRSVFLLADAPALFGQLYELCVQGIERKPELVIKISASALGHEHVSTMSTERHLFRFKDYEQAQIAMTELLSQKIPIISFRSCSLPLEDIFMKITRESWGKNKNEHRENSGKEEEKHLFI